MKILLLLIAVATSFFVGCSSDSPSLSPSESVAAEAAAAGDADADAAAAAVEVVATPQHDQRAARSGWPPSEACSFLNPALVTRGYKHDFDDEHHCSSPYKDIGASAAGLPNNLAYYVTGTSDVADTAKLVLNYNQPASDTAATKQLVEASKTLSLKATGSDLPANVLSALSKKRSAVETSGEFQHEVKRDDWPTGRGYEIHYIVTKSVER